MHPPHGVHVVGQRRRDRCGKKRRERRRRRRLEAGVDVGQAYSRILPQVGDIADERLGKRAVGFDDMFLLAGAGRGDRLLQVRDVIFLGVEAIEMSARQQSDQLVGGVAGVRRQPEGIVVAAPIEVGNALTPQRLALDHGRRGCRFRIGARRDGRGQRRGGNRNLLKKVHRPLAGAL